MLHIDIEKSFDAFNLNIAFKHDQGVLVLFGRSGSGKTTTLRCIAGIETPDKGTITLNSQTLFNNQQKKYVPIHRRNVGLIFQTPTLFPHMTARQNITYAAKHNPAPFDINKWLDRMAITHVADRHPETLSGGEQQRVSLIRAIAANPRFLLLDEPMSAVDLPTRQTLINQLRDLQAETNTPIIYVTHSPTEALQIGDRMIMIEDGSITAEGLPRNLLHPPTTVPLAGLSGTENILTGTIEQHDPDDHTSLIRVGDLQLSVPHLPRSKGQQATVAFRPEDVLAASSPITNTSARNQFPGQVTQIETGPILYLHVKLNQKSSANEEIIIRARVTKKSIDTLNLTAGSPIHLLIKTWSIYLVEETSKKR